MVGKLDTPVRDKMTYDTKNGRQLQRLLRKDQRELRL